MMAHQMIGEHESQVSEGGESDLQQLWDKCETNPGHPECIPIKSFTLKHLPEGHRDSDLYEYIKAAADLTVRIDVTMTSPHRPEFRPNTKIPYFLYQLKGKETFRTASGTVWTMRKYKDDGKQTCPCKECKASDKPRKVWWEIVMYSAAHVVFDNIEASHTTVRLFYDSEDSEEVILKDEVRVEYVNVGEDRCKFTCVICDENLGNKLEKMEEHYEDVCLKVYNKYKESRDIHKLNFIVSHPHGRFKQVSTGQWKDKTKFVGKSKGDHTFTYTTCTCPGSSGANVHCVGYTGQTYDPVHSRCDSGTNCSGVGEVW